MEDKDGSIKILAVISCNIILRGSKETQMEDQIQLIMLYLMMIP